MREAFDLFFSEEMMDLLLSSTNLKIEQTLSQQPQEALRDDTRLYLHTTEKCELYAVIGLFYYRGLMGLNNHSVHHIFSDRTGHPVLGGAMSRDRFYFLTSHLCFDDYRSRPERWEFDRFAAFRQFFELFSKECSKHITPSKYLFSDEILYPMRNQVAFRQYNPDKPAKCGVLLKSLNDARYS